MTGVYCVSFFGHRVINDSLKVEEQMEEVIRSLLREKSYVEFLVGRNGAFDQVAASTIRRCKRMVRDDNSALVLVLPYPTAELRNNEAAFLRYYDEIEICETALQSHYKYSHQVRNKEMVDRSDLVIFCVDHESGGAWQTMKYAKKRGVPYINIAERIRKENCIDP